MGACGLVFGILWQRWGLKISRMQLDKLAVHIRPLPPYQALDLGIAMARAWYKELSKCWLVALPSYAILFAIFAYRIGFGDEHTLYVSMWAMILILAIFRIQTEVVMVSLLAQKVFDKTANIQNAKTFLKDKKTFGTAIRHALSPTRVLAFSVVFLEGQQGKAKSKRLSSLLRGNGNAMWLSALAFFVVELILFWGGISLVVQMLDISPMNKYASSDATDFLFNNANDRMIVACVVVAYLLTIMVTTPFFVASAFALYLCRRSLVEGWDIELQFRQMKSRFDELSNSTNLTKKPIPQKSIPQQGESQ